MNRGRRKLVVVLTTVLQREAASMARTLVAERLAACVSRTTVQSVYRWREGIEEDAEELLLVKTTADLCGRLEERIGALSSYEVPEFIVLPAEQVAASYLSWALAACREAE